MARSEMAAATTAAAAVRPVIVSTLRALLVCSSARRNGEALPSKTRGLSGVLRPARGERLDGPRRQVLRSSYERFRTSGKRCRASSSCFVARLVPTGDAGDGGGGAGDRGVDGETGAPGLPLEERRALHPLHVQRR